MTRPQALLEIMNTLGLLDDNDVGAVLKMLRTRCREVSAVPDADKEAEANRDVEAVRDAMGRITVPPDDGLIN